MASSLPGERAEKLPRKPAGQGAGDTVLFAVRQAAQPPPTSSQRSHRAVRVLESQSSTVVLSTELPAVPQTPSAPQPRPQPHSALCLHVSQ
jgi:hypothetical protein